MPLDLSSIIASTIGVNVRVHHDISKLKCSCSTEKAEEIRLTLADHLSHCPQLWLSVDDPRKKYDSYSNFEQTIGHIDHVFFGALLSPEKFLIHETYFNDRHNWTGKISRDKNLLLETCDSETGHSTISLSLSLKDATKDLLIIDGDDYSELIFCINQINVDVRNNMTKKSER